MKHAVIVAHPNEHSLTHSCARSYMDAAIELGHEVVFRDLYRLGFDPCLKPGEIPGPGGFAMARDVLDERAAIADADVFALFYPLWFNAPPAILKGYVDRVFSAGFGYAPALGGTEPLLQGRKLISFTSSGAPDRWIQETGALKALITLFDAHLASTCGLSVVDHVHTGGVVSNITPEAVEAILDNVGAVVRDRFASRKAAAAPVRQTSLFPRLVPYPVVD